MEEFCNQLENIYSVDKYIHYCQYTHSNAATINEMDRNRAVIISFIVDNWNNLNYTEYELLMVSGFDHEAVFDFILYVHVNSRLNSEKTGNTNRTAIVTEQYLALLSIKSGYYIGCDYWKDNE